MATDHGGYKENLAGIGRYLSYILPQLDKIKFRITLVILRDTGSLENLLAGTGIKIYHLRQKKFNPYTFYNFIQIIRKENIHLLHLHQYACSNFGRLAGKITGVPSILHAHDLNYDYPWYQWMADRFLKNTTDHVIAVSEAAKSSCTKVRAIAPHKITVIPNAVSTDHLNHLNLKECRKLKKHWGLKEECQIVGTITRLDKVKGNDMFLKAAKIVLQTLPDTHFVLVGDGPLMVQLQEIARIFKIDHNVTFTGHQKDVAGLLSLFDVKVIASNTEGFSFALIEAMVMGKAIVATAAGGTKEILKDGKNGLLVPPRNPEVLAKKIIYLLQNKNERKRIGANAFDKSQRLTVDSHVQMLENIYMKSVIISQNLPQKRYTYDG